MSNPFGLNYDQVRADVDRDLAGQSQEQRDYFYNKAITPDKFSDGQWRVGWNDYWKARAMNPGSDSADPRLAGSQGIIQNPGQYGLSDPTEGQGNFGMGFGQLLQMLMGGMKNQQGPINTPYKYGAQNRGNLPMTGGWGQRGPGFNNGAQLQGGPPSDFASGGKWGPKPGAGATNFGMGMMPMPNGGNQGVPLAQGGMQQQQMPSKPVETRNPFGPQ
jgi:hypothetical protein